MTNILNRLIQATKDEPNYSQLGHPTGILGSSKQGPDTYDFTKHHQVIGKSRALTTRPPIVVAVLKDDLDE